LQELGTIELMVIGIYGRSSKSFILIVTNGLGPNDTQALSFFLEFYPQYVELVETYNIGRLATFLAKNVSNFMFGEQHLLINFSTIFVIIVPDVTTHEIIVEVHNKHIKGQNFVVNFEVCILDIFFHFFSFDFALQIRLSKFLFSFYHLVFIIMVFCGFFDGMYLCRLLASWFFQLELVALRMFVHVVTFHLSQSRLMAITIIIARTWFRVES
jgi:hypothetical protein